MRKDAASAREKYCDSGGMAFAHHHGGRLAWGVHDGDHGPFRGPRKRLICRGKAAGSGDPCPLGAVMDSSAFFSRESSTATTGAWPSPTITTSACLGVHDDDHGPVRRSPENARLQGKAAGSRGPCPFGGSDGLVCLASVFHHVNKYCHNGA